MSWTGLTEAALFVALGAALGLAYFVLLLQTVRLHASQSPPLRVVPLHIVRYAAAVATFWIIAQQGAVPLLLALSGFLVARISVQCRIGSV